MVEDDERPGVGLAGLAREVPAGSHARDPRELRPYCLLCGAEMLPLHCKYVCRNCGYRIDCSDRGVEPDWREPGRAG